MNWTELLTSQIEYIYPVTDKLMAAVDDDHALEALGSVESILAGEAPAGVAPTNWRGAVSSPYRALT